MFCDRKGWWIILVRLVLVALAQQHLGAKLHKSCAAGRRRRMLEGQFAQVVAHLALEDGKGGRGRHAWYGGRVSQGGRWDRARGAIRSS